MIKFLYTGADKFGYIQPIAASSIGGYISGSPVPNDSIGSLFGGTSVSNILSNDRQVRCIAIHNDSDAIIPAGSKLYYSMIVNNPICNFRMAISQPGQDSCGFFFEKLSNSRSKPTNVGFSDNRNEDLAIILPSIPIGGYLGLWIERSLNGTALSNELTCDNLNQLFESEFQSFDCNLTIDAVDVGGKYIIISKDSESIVVWFDEGSNSMPSISGTETIRVPILFSDNETQIAEKLGNILSVILQPRSMFNVARTANQISLTSIDSKSIHSVNQGDTSWEVTVNNPGNVVNQSSIEPVSIIIDTP